jgi:hypothetical protein
VAEIPPIKEPGQLKDFAGDDVALLGGIRRLSGQLTFQDDTANGGAQVTLAQLLSAAGGVAWTDLTDTPGFITANGVVFGNPGGTALEFRGISYQNLLATEPPVTGVINPGNLEISVFSGTQIQVAAGDLAIAIRTTALDVTEFQANHASASQITPVNLAARTSFWTASDTGLTGTVVIKEYATHPTVADLRREALLGVSLHDAGVVVAVINTPDIYRDQGQGLNDIWRPSNTEGLDVQPGTGQATEVGATLTIQTTAMIVEAKGIGFHSSSGVDPNHSPPIAAQNPFVYRTIEGDGTIFATGVSTFPTTWNNSGVETALTASRAVVHQVAWLASGEGIVQLGTNDYKNYDEAVSSITIERIQNPLWDIAREFGAVIGVVVISNDATTLWADGIAHLFPMSGGQVTVGGVTNYLGLTDTNTDYVGRVGQVPTVNSGEDALGFGTIRTQVLASFPGNIPGAPLVDIALPIPVNASEFHIDNVRLRVKVAESTTPVIIDVNINGTTIYPGSKPTLGTGVLTSDEAVSPDAVAVQGDALTIDLDAGGAVWEDLTVAIQGWSIPG